MISVSQISDPPVGGQVLGKHFSLTTFLSSSHLRQKASAACGRKNIVGAKIRCQMSDPPVGGQVFRKTKPSVPQWRDISLNREIYDLRFNHHHRSHPDFTSFIGIGYELSSHPDIDYYLIGIGF